MLKAGLASKLELRIVPEFLEGEKSEQRTQANPKHEAHKPFSPTCHSVLHLTLVKAHVNYQQV